MTDVMDDANAYMEIISDNIEYEHHMKYVISSMRDTTTKIINIRAYMVTALYNAPNTINHYYQQLVQHDMYGDSWEEKKMFQLKAEGDG